MIKLDQEPLLRDIAILDGRVTRMWQGKLNAAGVGIEVSEVELTQAPTPSRLRSVWKARRDGSARPVIIVAALGQDRVLLCGPDGDPPPVATLPAALASRILAAVLSEAPVPATRRAIDLLARAQGSGDVPGFRNRNLVSTHYVTQVLRRVGGADWIDAAPSGERALGTTDETLLRALGYQLETVGPKEYRVQDAGNAVALAHVYEDGTSLDRISAGKAAPPSSVALKRARELGLDHVLLVAGPLIRVYSLHARRGDCFGGLRRVRHASIATVRGSTARRPGGAGCAPAERPP